MPRNLSQALTVLALIILLALSFSTNCGPPPQVPIGDAEPGTYLFCFWNVENLFDDQNDGRENRGDKAYDGWFAQDPAALRLKLDHLSEALVELNGGRGPDLLAVAEVESPRAAELLQEALNSRLADPSLHYTTVLMKPVAAGRHIAPAILTRLPVRKDRTQLLGKRLRILEGHVQVQGHDLVVIASHWTAHVSDEHGEHRDKYADQIHGAFRGMYMGNPKVDLIVCGDFNDSPDSDSVTRHLRATGNLQDVLQPPEIPLLLNLFAGKDPEQGWGTHYYNGRWYIYDQFAISPGLLDDQGWTCEPESVQTINTLVKPGDKHRRPWRFGNEHEKGARGYSDHFPITVRLRVAGN